MPTPGKPVSLDQFHRGVGLSTAKTWGSSGYIQKVSFDRPAMELPAGHIFHRISTTIESSFSEATYAVASIEDFDRYVSTFRLEKGKTAVLHHVTFEAKAPIKVPHLTEVLETMREVLAEESGAPTTSVSKESAMRAYKALSGGSWTSSRGSSLTSALSKKGYGALVDEMDAGVIGDHPLVVFSKAVGEKVVQPLTEAAIKTAESSLIELSHRKL